MGTMMRQGRSRGPVTGQGLPGAWSRLRWEAARGLRVAYRALGMAGAVLVACAIASLAALLTGLHQQRALDELRVQSSGPHLRPSLKLGSLEGARTGNDRANLTAFDAQLLPHEQIPLVIENLIGLAQREHLSIERGEYRPVVDGAGRFLRYRMNLPVAGDPGAIQRFVQAALHSRKALALESVQFTRERIDSDVVEARIQWVLFTRLPQDGVDPGKDAPPGVAREVGP